MISRVADCCFWFGRYLERAESSARLQQATRTMVFDAGIPVTQCWAPLVIVSGEEKPFVERYERDAIGNGELVQEYLTWSEESQVSLYSSVRFARQCARAIRDQLSLDVWEEINELYHRLGRERGRLMYRDDREQFYRSVRRSTQLVLGLVRSTMLHQEPMSFLWAGVMLERVGQTARILDMHHHTMEREDAHDIVQIALWLSLLRACSGYEAFVKKVQGRVRAKSMVDFLLFDATFPRSLSYCLKSARASLGQIWTAAEAAERSSLQTIDALIEWLQARAGELEVPDVHAVLTHVVDETARACVSVQSEIAGPEAPPRASKAPDESATVGGPSGPA